METYVITERYISLGEIIDSYKIIKKDFSRTRDNLNKSSYNIKNDINYNVKILM